MKVQKSMVKGMGNELKISIYNVLGIEVYKAIERNPSFIIRNNNLANGNYFLRISDENGNHSNIKLLIN
ncbi:MAG: T9SS type A sorting domain-containing protein [Chitinophagales bacterium]